MFTFQTASCVAISPEGLVRYWQEVGQHSPWVDVNAHLGGEEVCVFNLTMKKLFYHNFLQVSQKW